MSEVFTQTTIPGRIHRRRRRAGRRTLVRGRRRVWASADEDIAFDVDEAITAQESTASIMLTSTADPIRYRSVAGRRSDASSSLISSPTRRPRGGALK